MTDRGISSTVGGILTDRRESMPSYGRYWEEIEVGEEYLSPGRTVTEADIVNFAGLSGDWNVIHTDAEFTKQSLFGERIAHGLLGLIVQSGLSTRAMPRPFATLAFTGLRWRFEARNDNEEE